MSEMNEIWALYAEEGRDSLDRIEDSLAALEDAPEDSDEVGGLFRAMHTFKGNSRMMGLSNVEALAHVAEDIVGLVRDHGVELSADILDVLVETTDMLRDMMEESIQTQGDVSPDMGDEVLAHLKEVFNRYSDSPIDDAVLQELPPMMSKEVMNAQEAEKERERQAEIEREEQQAAAQATEEEEQIEQGAVVFDPIEPTSLINDPVYRDIFSGMAQEIFAEMHAALLEYDTDAQASLAKLKDEAERLAHACEQMGLDHWLPSIHAVAEHIEGQAAYHVLADSVLVLTEMFDREIASPSETKPAAYTTDDPIREFFDMLSEPVQQMQESINALLREEGDAQTHLSVISDAVARIYTHAEPTGYVRLVEVIEEFQRNLTQDQSQFAEYLRTLQFRLFEELSAVQQVEMVDLDSLTFDADKALKQWCTDQVFEALMRLNEACDLIKEGHVDVAEKSFEIKELLKIIYYADQHYKLDTAGHLSMALVDLFERVRIGTLQVDALLLHITRSFVEDMEIVLNAVSSGDTPDMATIENLLEKAADAAFESQGTVSSQSIEARLNLPKTFHKVLTPDSVRDALTALDAKQNFYIIRASLEDDEELAGRFLAWVHSGAVKVISNVSVIQGQKTLFDFLVATSLKRGDLVSALSALDEMGTSLNLEMSLKDRKYDNGQAASSNTSASQTPNATATDDFSASNLTTDMLETIGEMVTSQAMVHHFVERLSEIDLFDMVENVVQQYQGDWHKARLSVRQTIDRWQEQLDDLSQSEIHLGTMLDNLQEEALALRMRPAGLLTRPNEAFAQELAEACMKKITVDVEGSEQELDVTMLEQLKSPLKSLMAFVVTQSIESPETRIGLGKSGSAYLQLILKKHEDHISIELSDDGIGVDLATVAQKMRDLGWSGEANESVILREGFGAFANPNSIDPSGVNLAEIASQVRRQGGTLSVENQVEGMHITMKVPLAMIVQEGMVVRTGGVHYVIPIDNIQRIVRPESQMMMDVSAGGGHQMIRLNSDDIVTVGQLLKSEHAALAQAFNESQDQSTQAQDDLKMQSDQDEDRRIFVVVEKDQQQVALEIDELMGQQQVLVRPLQGYLSSIRGVTGSALLGSGDVGMMLDVGYMTEQSQG